MPWGTIFDWDGVIVDSAAQHEESWNRLAHREGLRLPEGHFKRGFGMKNEYIIPELLGWTRDRNEIRRLSLEKEELYREVMRETSVTALPGVEAWLTALRQAFIPCAVGSSTQRLNITCALDQLGWSDRFDAIVSAEDVPRGKPHPDVFLAAAKQLTRSPDRCVVFEDTPIGIQAARAAGMRVVGVSTTHPAASLREADRVVTRLDELTVPGVGAWFDDAASSPEIRRTA